MATTKKKSTTKKKPVARKVATTTKTRKVAPKKVQKAPVVGLANEELPFFTFRITTQTVYWSIILILVLALGLWVISVNDKVQHIYDQMEASADSSVIDQ